MRSDPLAKMCVYYSTHLAVSAKRIDFVLPDDFYGISQAAEFRKLQ